MDINLTTDFLGITEFRSEMSQTLERIEKTKRPMILTKGGAPSVVILDVQSYQEMQDALKEAESALLLASVQRAELDIANGRTLPHAQALEVFEKKRQQRRHGQKEANTPKP
jgi:prevent-host-death family protein